jgi:hypothetical protein
VNQWVFRWRAAASEFSRRPFTTNYYKRWFGTDVELPRVRVWVNGTLKEQWRARAAVPTWLICTAGRGGKFADPFEKAHPDKKAKKNEDQDHICTWFHCAGKKCLPGNAKRLLGSRRREPASAQLERMGEIPELDGDVDWLSETSSCSLCTDGSRTSKQSPLPPLTTYLVFLGFRPWFPCR